MEPKKSLRSEKMRNRIFLFIPVVWFGMQTCDEAPERGLPISSDFVYPLSIGNRWNYTMSITYSDIRPDSISHYLQNNTIEYNEIVTKDTLLDTLRLYEIYSGSEDLAPSYAYFANDSDGFFQYAYLANQSDLRLPKAIMSKGHLQNLHDLTRGSLLFNKLSDLGWLSKAQSDSIHFLDEPNMIYAYPWTIGASWIYSFEPRIEKKVIGIETVKTKAGIYDCYRIQWMTTNPIYAEYVGIVGLVKSVIRIDDLTVTTPEHPEGVGQADMKIIITLDGVNF